MTTTLSPILHRPRWCPACRDATMHVLTGKLWERKARCEKCGQERGA